MNTVYNAKSTEVIERLHDMIDIIARWTGRSRIDVVAHLTLISCATDPSVLLDAAVLVYDCLRLQQDEGRVHFLQLDWFSEPLLELTLLYPRSGQS